MKPNLRSRRSTAVIDPTHHLNRPMWLAATLSSAAAMLACSPGDDAPGLTLAPPDGQFFVRLTDAPTDGIAQVWVTVEALQIRACQGSWIHVPMVPVSYELLALRDGHSAPLAPAVGVAPGRYCELRFEVAREGNYVVLDDFQTHELKVPSSEVKLKTQFEIAGGLVTEVTLDLDADESIKSTQSGKVYVMHPIVDVQRIDYSHTGSGLGGAHDYLGSTTLFVDPFVGAFYDLDGATIWLPPGAVSEPTAFSATRWGHRSEQAVADLYHFYPPYEFGVEPVISITHTPDANVDFSVFIDGWEQDSDNPQADIVEADVPHFCDIERWYINRMNCEGIMEVDDMEGDDMIGTFRADENINRVEFLKIVALVSTQKGDIDTYVGGEPLFGDVDANAWYHRYLRWGVEKGVIDGSKDDFHPGEDVNRVEAIKILMSAARIYDGDSGGAGPRLRELGKYLRDGTLNQDEEVFPDVRYYGQGEPPWYYQYVYAAQRANIIGTDDGTEFHADAPLTRAEAAKLICLASGHCAMRELESRLFCDDPNTQCDQLLDGVEIAVVDCLDPIGDRVSEGIDFGDNGEVVYAPASGLVTDVDEACGTVTIADEFENVEYVLAHLDLDLDSSQKDQWIARGTLVGTVVQGQAQDCASYPAGLHYDLRHTDGVAENPYAPPSAPRRVPRGWRQIGLSAPSGGIEVYQKGHDYVGLIDLRQARIDLLTGSIVKHVVNDDKVAAKTREEFVADAKALVGDESPLGIVISGTFGNTVVYYPDPENPDKKPPNLSIAHGLQSDGELVSHGASPSGFDPECTKDGKSYVHLATFNNALHRAWIGDHNLPSFDQSPDIMGGLDVVLCPKGKDYTLRTVVANCNDNHDGYAETVLVFSSKGSTQKDAADARWVTATTTETSCTDAVRC